MLHERYFNVSTSCQRPSDIDLMSCVGWESLVHKETFKLKYLETKRKIEPMLCKTSFLKENMQQ